jgi:NADH-quinone oxidoreductase subunit E
MSHYLIELLVYAAIAYVIGCMLGAAFRRMFGAKPVFEEANEPMPIEAPVEVAPVAQPAPAPAPVRVAEPVAAAMPLATGKMERPRGISKARGDKADNLQRISGVGPKNEKVLHNLGFFHFDQIAAWTAEQIEWVDDHLKFNGRIKREEWVKQARLLADGKEAEFHRLYGTGGMKNASGETQSGSRTRRS